MVAVQKSIVKSNKKKQLTPESNLEEKLKGLQSEELVIALSGAVGSGRDVVLSLVRETLKKSNYKFVHIKLSKLIKENFESLKENPPELMIAQELQNLSLDDLPVGHKRTDNFMTAGNFLRKFYGNDFLAQTAINEIHKLRIKESKLSYENYKEEHPEILIEEYATEYFSPERTVYVLDQLKHPSEAKLLRSIYGDLFYLLGTLCNAEERSKNLQKHMSKSEANALIEKDKKDSEPFGQQLEKTLQLSDYFIRSSNNDRKHLSRQINRFVNIIHGNEIITPTSDEYGM